jgi:hypothetical protein
MRVVRLHLSTQHTWSHFLSVCLSSVLSASTVTGQLSPVRFGNNKGERKKLTPRDLFVFHQSLKKIQEYLILILNACQKPINPSFTVCQSMFLHTSLHTRDTHNHIFLPYVVSIIILLDSILCTKITFYCQTFVN